MVRRGETTYPISTGRIGKTAAPTHAKSWGHLHADVQLMKEKGSPRACLLLSIIDNWVFGRDTPSECLEAIEQVLRDEVERSL